MSNKKTAQLTVAEYQALIVGIPKYAPNAIFMVASQTFTATEAVTFLQTLHDSSAGTVAAKAAWKQAVSSDQVLEAANGLIAREMRDTVALMFSNADSTLQAFSLKPRKPPTPLTTAARAAANAKAKATRAARGTKGSVQKAAITGNVSGVTITPVLLPTAQPAVATAAPAPAASGVSSGATTAVSTAPHS
jgi:hypothetical protein